MSPPFGAKSDDDADAAAFVVDEELREDLKRHRKESRTPPPLCCCCCCTTRSCFSAIGLSGIRPRRSWVGVVVPTTSMVFSFSLPVPTFDAMLLLLLLRDSGECESMLLLPRERERRDGKRDNNRKFKFLRRSLVDECLHKHLMKRTLPCSVDDLTVGCCPGYSICIAMTMFLLSLSSWSSYYSSLLFLRRLLPPAWQ